MNPVLSHEPVHAIFVSGDATVALRLAGRFGPPKRIVFKARELALFPFFTLLPYLQHKSSCCCSWGDRTGGRWPCGATLDRRILLNDLLSRPLLWPEGWGMLCSAGGVC